LCQVSSSTSYCVKERQLCDISTGKARCICAEGWKGYRCEERINEPPSSLPTKMPTFPRVRVNCTQNSECSDDNSYCLNGECRCESGFTPRRGSCVNINECDDTSNGCDAFADCIDTLGSYECRCRDGFSDVSPTLPGRQCRQTNECRLGTHNCNETTQVCVDRRPPEKWECVERTPAPTLKPTRMPTSPPTPSPTQTPVCFSGDATAIVKGRGKVAMRNLSIGDLVLVKEGTFEPVIASGHRDFHQLSEFLSITTNSTSESALELSADHILFLYHENTPVASKLLKVGSILLGRNNEPLEVIEIKRVIKEGIFSPSTLSGTIVVNGVFCSNYAFSMNQMENDGIYFLFYGRKVMTLHSFHHLRQSPLRLAILGISSSLSDLEDKDGRHIFLKFYGDVYSNKNDDPRLVVRMISFVIWHLLLLLSCLCYSFEHVFGPQIALTMLTILTIVCFMLKRSVSLDTKMHKS
jgi:hypothetical protein